MIISIDEGCALLLSGQVVGIPTETVYGLAGVYDTPQSHELIYALKKRPRDNPLIVHIATLDDLSLLTESVNENHYRLIDAFWPGPLTVIFSARSTLPPTVTGNQPTVAVRMPRHPAFLEVLKRTGPLVAPSANTSGRPSPTRAAHVENDFGKSFPVIDGGLCECGLESTIVLVTESGTCRILREGAISKEAISKVVPLSTSSESVCRVPGSKYKHYAPSTPLKALANDPVRGVIGFSDRKYRAQHVFSLGSSTDPDEIGRNLYNVLRAIDSSKLPEVHVDLNFPTEGLFATIHERLEKAMALHSETAISLQ